MADKHIAAVEPAKVDTHMDIEVGNPTNVDTFYLFWAKPFSIRSLTSIPYMALEKAKGYKLHRIPIAPTVTGVWWTIPILWICPPPS